MTDPRAGVQEVASEALAAPDAPPTYLPALGLDPIDGGFTNLPA